MSLKKITLLFTSLLTYHIAYCDNAAWVTVIDNATSQLTPDSPPGELDVGTYNIIPPASRTFPGSSGMVHGFTIKGNFDGDQYDQIVQIEAPNGYYVCTVEVKKDSATGPIQFIEKQGTKQIRTLDKCLFSQQGNSETVNIINYSD